MIPTASTTSSFDFRNCPILTSSSPNTQSFQTILLWACIYLHPYETHKSQYRHSLKLPLQHVPHWPENTMDNEESHFIEERSKSIRSLRSEARDLVPTAPRFETSWLIGARLLGVCRVILVCPSNHPVFYTDMQVY